LTCSIIFAYVELYSEIIGIHEIAVVGTGYVGLVTGTIVLLKAASPSHALIINK